MLTFNNNNIVTGYIKQLLKSTYLPSLRILNKNNYIMSNVKYIYNSNLYYCEYFSDKDKISKALDFQTFINSAKKLDQVYLLDKNYLNSTSVFNITNNIYDTYTHEYLGKYLRYIRDSKDVNLMSMYNCFSNNIVKNIKIINSEKGINFNSDDSNYKIYAVPVKLLQQYTIAVDANIVEIIACEYKNNTVTESIDSNYYNSSFANIKTYRKLSNLKFNKPILYKNLLDSFTLNNNSNPRIPLKLVENEDNLRLLIKVPFTNNSSIVILEGDYVANSNYSIINSKINRDKSQLQLLRFNDNISYPFADRLLEYLFDQAISPLNDYKENYNYILNYASPYLSNYDIFGNNKLPFWSDGIENIIQELQKKNNLNNKYLDLLPYLDKDTALYIKEE